MDDVLPHVLVIDHSEKNLDIIKSTLSDVGANLVTLSQADDVVVVAKKLKPAVIVLDTDLNGICGYHLLSILKSCPEIAHIPIILTPHQLGEQQMKLYAHILQFVEVLPRPFNQERLKTLVTFFVCLQPYRYILDNIGSDKPQRSLVERGDQGILVINDKGRICFANASAEQLLMCPVTQLVGLYFESLLPRNNQTVSPDWCNQSIVKSVRKDQMFQANNQSLRRADGEAIQVDFVIIPAFGLAGDNLIFAFKRIKKTRESTTNQSKKLGVDYLTGLPERTRIEAIVMQRINDAQIVNQQFALMFLNLDHFKHINETLGYDRGDSLIKVVAERLQNIVRFNDVVGRIKGDEFVVVLDALEHLTEVDVVATKIIDSLHEPFMVDGHVIFIGCSMGITLYPNCGDDAMTLINNAAVAATRAKRLGRNNYQFYTTTMNQQQALRVAQEQALNEAFELDQFELSCSALTHQGSAKGILYANLIWNHPTKGRLASVDFMSELTNPAFKSRVDRWAWDNAILELVSCADKKAIAVSVSPAFLMQAAAADWMLERVLKAGIKAEQLFIQIDEPAWQENARVFSETITTLKESGFQFILGDFGVSNGSFELIKNTPCSVVKLAPRLLNEMRRNNKGAIIVDSIIYLSHGLGLEVMATDILDQSQFIFLQQKGCDWLGEINTATQIADSALSH